MEGQEDGRTEEWKERRIAGQEDGSSGGRKDRRITGEEKWNDRRMKG